MSTNKKNRIKHLSSLKNEPRTMIFYEAPHKLLSTLKDLYVFLGNRDIAIVRELTKIHEEVKFMKILDSINLYSIKPKGEFVILVQGIDTNSEPAYTLKEAIEMAQTFVSEGVLKTSAAKKAAKITNIKKSDIYKNIL